ncbi:MAG TPA: nucleotide disphospho-sugar-binding domain-containing protein [Anaerolineae bacterium]|jgi:UDP:flavonoid glycosyltransferase YjiC (YdhE family)|nr:nucleotide disphospho-sugar-binding domain-containing protein [Anaerolineae bacterium]
MSKRKSFLFIVSAKGGGDRPPVIALACALRDRGRRVGVLCDDESAQLIASTKLPSYTFPSDLDRRGQITRWIKDLAQENGEPSAELLNPMLDWANPLIPFGQETLRNFKPDLIVSTLFGIGLADELSKHSRIPWCFVNPSFYFGEDATRTWEEDWYGPFIPRLARDCFLPLVEQADIVLHATDPEFDFQPTRVPDNHHYVGFLLWDPPLDGSVALDGPGNPWALITLSTLRQGDEAVLANSALQALADRPVRALLTQPDEDIRSELSDIPENATIAGFVSHSPVLKKSSLVINHAGHGVVSKAITYGVPMVLLPWHRDQPGVADRAARLGIAQVVPREKANPEEVRRAVDAVLDSPRYREAALHHAERLAAIDAAEIACSFLEGF